MTANSKSCFAVHPSYSKLERAWSCNRGAKTFPGMDQGDNFLLAARPKGRSPELISGHCDHNIVPMLCGDFPAAALGAFVGVPIRKETPFNRLEAGAVA